MLYLTNKVFLDLMERERGRNEEWFWFWKKRAWEAYILGLPFIVVCFFRERAWIFGWVEFGGLPSMLCGLIAARSRRDAPKWLDWTALAAIPIGIALSVHDFGGINTVSQWLEIGGSSGFLVGTYLLAKDRQSGYWWFLLMNAATGGLFYIQHHPAFVAQQIVSVAFNLDAYRIRRKAPKVKSVVMNPRPA